MKKKLCVVVPYRDRQTHLDEFVPYMQNILAGQNIDYHIMIVEQADGKPFNRAKLLNVGYHHTKPEYDYYCFHDVDMLPLDSDYAYCDAPTHLAAAAEQFGWKLPYPQYFGGVTIFNNESFELINGYSNEYWGWGAEDDDVYRRVIRKGLTPLRKNGRYRSLHHDRYIPEFEYKQNVDYLHRSASLIDTDGLSTLNYEVVESITLDDYTKIKIEI